MDGGNYNIPFTFLKKQGINIIKFQFQRFLYQTLCVFSQMKDIKHIKQDFHSVTWVMPQGWDLWGWGCQGGQKHGNESCGISNSQG